MPNMTQLITYQPDMTAGALKVPESRIIADLLLRKSDWKEAIVRQNVLQAKTVASAVRLSNLIRARLQPMGDELLKLIRDGKGLVATHAVFVSTLKHSRLFFDFLSLVVADHHRLHARELPKNVWGKFLEQCRERDPLMPVWSEETKRRLRSSIFLCLAEAGYIESTKNPRLQTVHIAAPVLEYLERHQEKAIIKAMAVHA
jgi:hypothetical protein